MRVQEPPGLHYPRGTGRFTGGSRGWETATSAPVRGPDPHTQHCRRSVEQGRGRGCVDGGGVCPTLPRNRPIVYRLFGLFRSWMIFGAREAEDRELCPACEPDARTATAELISSLGCSHYCAKAKYVKFSMRWGGPSLGWTGLSPRLERAEVGRSEFRRSVRRGLGGQRV